MVRGKVTAEDVILDRLVLLIKDGNIQRWAKSWNSTQRNFFSQHEYTGVNWLLTTFSGFSSPYWGTWKQWTEHQFAIKEPEKKNFLPVVFWKFLTFDKGTDDEKTVPFMRYYRVYNATQIVDWVEPENQVSNFPIADTVVAQMPNKPTIMHNGLNKAYYQPQTDSVHLPLKSTFRSTEGYYQVLFHELGHATGHKSRLDRPGVNEVSFGSDKYSFEELIAELTSAFVLGHCGIVTEEIMHNTAAYLQGWLKSNDPTMLLRAGTQANKAHHYITGKEHQQPEKSQLPPLGSAPRSR